MHRELEAVRDALDEANVPTEEQSEACLGKTIKLLDTARIEHMAAERDALILLNEQLSAKIAAVEALVPVLRGRADWREHTGNADAASDCRTAAHKIEQALALQKEP